ncbi:unnamed protein product [Dibothriocephalus latus]|uniref:Uncharacterized protein n=1 Tax=Dibothriocephalus latus TaxID=60516 RepID=A0A3P7LZH0_DIBLA|nr:unnamed protein product [Dibothriocephalus latus]
MEVLDSCETLFLFELEYWREVNVVKRPAPQTLPTATTTTSGAASERVSTTVSNQASGISPGNPTSVDSGHRNTGSSTTLVSNTGCATGLDALPTADFTSSSPVKRFVFCFRTADAKADWLGTMIALQTKRFTQPDTVNTIQFERPQVDSSAEIPVIKAATITKLVERMTYHAYYDSKSIRTFLQVVFLRL